MLNERALEHGPVHARGVQTEISEGVRCFQIQEGGQVPNAELQIEESRAFMLVG